MFYICRSALILPVLICVIIALCVSKDNKIFQVTFYSLDFVLSYHTTYINTVLIKWWPLKWSCISGADPLDTEIARMY
jgi:hypothetical protein